MKIRAESPSSVKDDKHRPPVKIDREFDKILAEKIVGIKRRESKNHHELL